MLNYSQIVSILISINHNLPSSSQSYFQISSVLTSLTSQAFSIDCFIYYLDLDENPLHLKALISVFLPFFIWLILLFGLLIKKMKGKTIEKGKILTYFLIICNFFQPSILQQLVDNLNCKTIGSSSFIFKEMNFECNSQNHLNWVHISNF